MLLSSDDGIRKPSGVTGLYSAFSYTAMVCAPEVSRPQRSRGRRMVAASAGKEPQCVSLYSPYGPDHGVGHSGPAGASVQKHTVLNNSLSDDDLPERKCERQKTPGYCWSTPRIVLDDPKVTSLSSVAGMVRVVWHASQDGFLPIFTTEIIYVVKNISAECCDAQVYTWGVAMVIQILMAVASTLFTEGLP